MVMIDLDEPITFTRKDTKILVTRLFLSSAVNIYLQLTGILTHAFGFIK